MFHLGGAGGYPIVPRKNSIETLNLTLFCLEWNRMGKIAKLQRGGLRKKQISGYFKQKSFLEKLITWQEHRVGEPQCWQHRLMLSDDFCDKAEMSYVLI